MIRNIYQATILVTFVCLLSLSANCAKNTTSFLGRWALYLPGGAGWLEIRNEKSYEGYYYPVAYLLWYGGSVKRLIEKPDMHDNTLNVWRTHKVDRQKDADGNTIYCQQIMTRIEFILVNANEIKGREINPNKNGWGVNIREFTGKRIPPPGPAPDLNKLTFGNPVTLFNDKDLIGWELADDKDTNGWSVVDGALVNHPKQIPGQ